MNRLATIVKAFNKLTSEEKLQLKNWLAHILSEEIKDEVITEKNKRFFKRDFWHRLISLYYNNIPKMQS
ncbi:hypothetical protein CS063_14190 [Sporanaerobium hydrogeniformans]|uniref:Uncharacterized protein n=1 Tax=Sporanaerobium hydrogeniformans TaxID=3072179 RepID=A0AC61DAE9_9FIRM|nr:hypothetical protein [Sporanaerobium hydrogeniformans]PHV69743.1 hypothetical protein CS063_14190 [Sporanaerobium hydrogeniformans]